jgi:hypothetical protein
VRARDAQAPGGGVQAEALGARSQRLQSFDVDQDGGGVGLVLECVEQVYGRSESLADSFAFCCRSAKE